MPTIQQAQAKVKINDLGASRSDFTAPNLNTVEAMITLYAEEFIKSSQDNLNKTNSVTTGNLSDSIQFETTFLGRGFNVQFLVADYYDYVNKGVQGAGSSRKNNTSPYKFKFITPSKSHVAAIEKWIIRNRLTYTVRDKVQTKREKKAISAQVGRKTLAYLIARSIKRDGLYATNFWDDAFDDTFRDFGQQMSKALGVDIVVDLNKMRQNIKLTK